MLLSKFLLFILYIGFLTVLSVHGGDLNFKDGTYLLHWTIQGDDLEIEATVFGIGYVGFGVGIYRNMTSADIFVAGLNSADNTPYAWDMHGVSNNFPVMDDEPNYELMSATENDTHTTVIFRRPLISTDKEHDLDVTNNVQFIQWAVGSNDNLEYHFSNRGFVELNLFDDPE